MDVFEFNIKESLHEVVRNIKNPWACYVLYQNTPIHRLGKIDKKGILYIGKADNLYVRVSSLQKSVLSNCNGGNKPNIKGHKSLSKKVFRIQKFLDTSKMTIKVFVLPSYHSILYTESFLIEDYVFNYGELPPLNGQYGNYEYPICKTFIKANSILLDYL